MIAIMPEYMTVAEAARALGLSERAVHKRITTGPMQAERFGALVWQIPVEEVERAKAAGRLKPGPKRRDETATEERARENREHLEALEEERRRIRGET